MGGPGSVDNNYDSPWGSIVMSASAVANCVSDSLTDLKDRDKDKDEDSRDEDNGKDDKEDVNGNESENEKRNKESGKREEKEKDEMKPNDINKVIMNDNNIHNDNDNDKVSKRDENEIELSPYSSKMKMELDEKDKESYALTNFYSEYVCLSLNLFSCCMAVREVHNVGNDTPIVGAIIGIIATAINPLRAVLTTQNNNDNNNKKRRTRILHKMREDQWLILPLIASINCLEICVKQVGYQVAFRESEGLGPLTDIIEMFGINSHLFPNLVRNSVKCVLDSSLSLLCTISSNVRRNTTGSVESGVQVLYQQYFSKLCCKIFLCSFKEMKLTWIHLLKLISLAIDVEPAFLAIFLHSSYANILSDILKKLSRIVLLPYNSEIILMPLTWLASSLSITPDGLSYIINNNFLPLIIQILVDPSLSHPNRDGISSDVISRYVCKYMIRFDLNAFFVYFFLVIFVVSS